MFKKLRNNFLALNMAITSLVMLAALGTVYVTTHNNFQMENERKLNNVMNSFVTVDKVEAVATEHPQGGQTKVTTNYSLSFILTVDNDANIIAKDSFIDMPDKLYEKAAEMAWKKGGRSTITLSGRQWMYRIFPANFQMRSEDGRHSLVSSFDNRHQIAFLVNKLLV